MSLAITIEGKQVGPVVCADREFYHRASARLRTPSLTGYKAYI